MKIGIFANNINESTGPGKLVKNLAIGLNNVGINFELNSFGNFNGLLQPNNFDLFPKETLIGPNIMVLPNEMPNVWKKFKNHVSPSVYVKNIYETFPEVAGCNINIWSVGIDVDRFNITKNYKNDFLIYVKNRKEEELNKIVNILEKNNLTFKILRYGSYSEQQLIESLIASKFCILLTHTESQGIAYMEILSSGTPCLSFSIETKYNMPHSSVPYFDDRCGKKFIEISEENVKQFLDGIKNYNPREYIIENHTLELSAKKYVDLLIKAHNEA